METTLSSKGQVVLPVEVRRHLHLTAGERLTVELHDDGVLLRSPRRRHTFRRVRDPASGLPYRMAVPPVARKVTAAEIARLHAELI